MEWAGGMAFAGLWCQRLWAPHRHLFNSQSWLYDYPFIISKYLNNTFYQWPHLSCQFRAQKFSPKRSVFFADLNLCVLLGLCHSKDVSLIRGNGKTQDKIDFLKRLIDLVLLNCSYSEINPVANKTLLNEIVADSKAILSKQIPLFSVDMDPIYTTKGNTLPPMDVESLIVSVKTKLSNLDRKLATIDVSGLQIDGNRAPRDIDVLKKEVSNQFMRLQSIVKLFSAIYEADIQPWLCSSIEPKLTGVGPKATQLLQVQESLQSMLTNIKQLKQGYMQIVAPESVAELNRCDLEINEHTILAVQEQSAVLERAFIRRQDTGLLYG